VNKGVGGGLQMRTSAHFDAKKNLNFFKIMVCQHGQEGGGVEIVKIFCGRGKA